MVQNITEVLIIELLLQTGIRIGELANLRMDDVRETVLYVRVFEGHGEREVPLNKRAKARILRIKLNRDITVCKKHGVQFENSQPGITPPTRNSNTP